MFRKKLRPGPIEARNLPATGDDDFLAMRALFVAAPALLAQLKALVAYLELHGDTKEKDYSRRCLEARQAIRAAEAAMPGRSPVLPPA